MWPWRWNAILLMYCTHVKPMDHVSYPSITNDFLTCFATSLQITIWMSERIWKTLYSHKNWTWPDILSEWLQIMGKPFSLTYNLCHFTALFCHHLQRILSAWNGQQATVHCKWFTVEHNIYLLSYDVEQFLALLFWGHFGHHVHEIFLATALRKLNWKIWFSPHKHPCNATHCDSDPGEDIYNLQYYLSKQKKAQTKNEKCRKEHTVDTFKTKETEEKLLMSIHDGFYLLLWEKSSMQQSLQTNYFICRRQEVLLPLPKHEHYLHTVHCHFSDTENYD